MHIKYSQSFNIHHVQCILYCRADGLDILVVKALIMYILLVLKNVKM